MKRVRRRDTAMEIALRSSLHRMGYRFRVDQRVEASLRYRGDIVFRRQRVAVFVDGCFWHGCAIHGTIPKSNTTWWQEKITRNRSRDLQAQTLLRDAGWRVLRFWEHDAIETCSQSIVAALGRRE
jgi:DNA mismatch endonuclease (patch repair protein)